MGIAEEKCNRGKVPQIERRPLEAAEIYFWSNKKSFRGSGNPLLLRFDAAIPDYF
jgi:hypothetical protein